MTAISANPNVPGNAPDIYEGSYKDIFTYVNFNFSVFSTTRSENSVGRPKGSDLSKFKAIVLKYLALNSSYRMIEAKLAHDPELAEILGFDPESPPSDTVLKKFFADLKLEQILEVYRHLLQELRAFGYAQGRIVALDSTPIAAHCHPPTKKGAPAKDPDARWGKAKCKGGWYFGYKAQVLVDAEDYLPLYPITTPANVSDQKMVAPFIAPLKKLGYHPTRMLLDAGYDSKENHFLLREKLGAISQICPNSRRSKRTFSKKLIRKYKKLLYQTTLDRYIPKEKRKKEYRKCCLVLQNDKEYKQFFRMRIACEQQFATLKKDLFLESHRMIGLEKIKKHVALKCLCMIVIALAALRMGIPEAIRSPKYFQH